MKSSLRDIFWAFVVRLILICHTFVAYWRITDVTQNGTYWYLLILNVLVLGETFYRIKVKRGKEAKWFCPCFLFYLICTVPAIYILELDRLEAYNKIFNDQNITQSVGLSTFQGVTLPITLNPDIWVSVIEQSMLFLMILGRWLLPRGGLSRDQLSQLLFVYIGMGSDNMELFVLFEESPVRQDRLLTFGILGIWTISLIQFSVVLTATKKSKSKTKSRVTPSGSEDLVEHKESCVVGCFRTELWSLVLTFCCQDGPYLSIRLYAMIAHRLITYSIIFFTCKNLFIIGLLLYRLFVMCFDKEDEDSPKEDIVTRPRKSQLWPRRLPRNSTSSVISEQRNGVNGQMSPNDSVFERNDYRRQPSSNSKGSKKLSVISLDI
ncbi:transmembrane protein 26-like [Gigantopelta aegis]|uniref:transmembrane protein 26-like n=1 Tax=Gigantopelta aegis TaxID=1735272 RepID=UPI001B889F04|nr:transmembrane protein 26-like [Gigantopelta aegis]